MSIITSIQNLLTAANAVTTSQLGADGMKVINDAVVAAEAIGGSGTVKFSAALAKAEIDLLALGKDVGLFGLHLAIEYTVNTLYPPAAAIVPTVAPTEAPAASA